MSKDPRMLDLTAFDRPATRDGGAEPSDLYLLRLALDLQLDAMLLTLGAAAHAEAQGPDPDDGIPWQRWLAEDLELVRALAVPLHEGESASGSGTGGGSANTGAEASLEQLAARYESMERLLTRLLSGQQADQRWSGPAAEALRRCRSRLGELHRHRHRQLVIAAGVPQQNYLPGELLG